MAFGDVQGLAGARPSRVRSGVGFRRDWVYGAAHDDYRSEGLVELVSAVEAFEMR